MAINISTQKEIKERIVQDFDTEYGKTVPILLRAFLRVWAGVLSGFYWLFYKFGQRVSLNILPTTAEAERLDDFGELLPLTRQPEVAFSGTATVNGTDGQIVRAGNIYVGANGIEYLVTEDATIASGTATINITSQTAGSETTLAIGSILNISIPQSGFDNTSEVASVITEGQDGETDEAYRERIIQRFNLRPQGGATQDYINWAETVTGVTRVFPFEIGANNIDLYFLRDNDVDRIPDAAEILAVKNAIYQPLRRPLGATVNVKAPTNIEYRVTVTNFTPNIQSIKDQVEADIQRYFLEREMYVNPNISQFEINIIKLFEIVAIVGAFGSADNVTLIRLTANPSGDDFELKEGEVCTTEVII